MTKPLIIRADANKKIGEGHIMRCLALAQAYQDIGGRIIFVMAMDAGSLFEKLKKERMDIQKIDVVPGSDNDARQTTAVVHREVADWVILDGYHFSSKYQKIIKDSDIKILMLDDNCEQDHYYADYILNQNIHAVESLYPPKKRETYTKLLLGTKYCLLRREFLEYKDFKREIPQKAKNILVTMGGSDSNNVTCKVIEAFKQINDSELNIKVVLGGNNPHYEKVKQAVDLLPSKTEIIVNAHNMPELMMWADLAISAAGSTVWEMCFLKLPFIAIVTADNQCGIAEYIKSNVSTEKVCNSIKTNFRQKLCKFINSPPEYQNITLSDIVDGKGANKILKIILAGKIMLREAQTNDCELLWQWANDLAVRKNAFAQDSISLQCHEKWFFNKLSAPNCYIYIGEIEHIPCGQIRFEVENDDAIIDISVASGFRGIGIGTEIIQKGVQMFFAACPITRVKAIILKKNLPSINSFRRADFKEFGNTVVAKANCIIMIKEK